MLRATESRYEHIGDGRWTAGGRCEASVVWWSASRGQRAQQNWVLRLRRRSRLQSMEVLRIAVAALHREHQNPCSETPSDWPAAAATLLSPPRQVRSGRGLARERRGRNACPAWPARAQDMGRHDIGTYLIQHGNTPHLLILSTFQQGIDEQQTCHSCADTRSTEQQTRHVELTPENLSCMSCATMNWKHETI